MQRKKCVYSNIYAANVVIPFVNEPNYVIVCQSLHFYLDLDAVTASYLHVASDALSKMIFAGVSAICTLLWSDMFILFLSYL